MERKAALSGLYTLDLQIALKIFFFGFEQNIFSEIPRRPAAATD